MQSKNPCFIMLHEKTQSTPNGIDRLINVYLTNQCSQESMLPSWLRLCFRSFQLSVLQSVRHIQLE